jgi:tRNA(Arg) A34 adenosine deaminase TadA
MSKPKRTIFTYMNEKQIGFMREAIRLSQQGMNLNEGGPFGCVIVLNGTIIGRGNNKVTSTNDPTAHAEVTALREACKHLNTFQLPDCELYTSCEPCPMCLGAIYWAKLKKIYYACSRTDAASIGFSDEFIYHEICLELNQRAIPIEQMMREEAFGVFKEWTDKPDKITY